MIVDKDRQKIRHLLIVKDQKGKRAVPLSLAVYSLGRSQDNSIVLHSSTVSRYHATILPIANSTDKLAPFQIIDGSIKGIKSTNGLLINGVQCDRHHLKHGDFIEFGNKVKVTYYTLFNLSESEFARFCDLQSSFDTTDAILTSQIDTINSSQVARFNELVPINSASFFQLIPHPLIEIDLSGAITYYNFSAIKQFPELLTLKQNHPLIKELLILIQQGVSSHFVREIKFHNKLFTQSVQYSLSEKIIQILITEVTEDRETTIPQYSDRLIREVVASSGSFEQKINSLLKIGCECFELDVGFLAKLQQNTLTIAAIDKLADTRCFLEPNQIIHIDPDSSQQSLKLFQATIEAEQVLTIQQFEQQSKQQINIRSSATEFMPITAYLGVSLTVGKKLYGILAFCSSTKNKQFDRPQIDFLTVLKQCLVKEIKQQKIELVLARVLQQKNYYQQIAEDIINPIDEVKAIAQKLINTIDLQENNPIENEPDDIDSWLSLIDKLGDI